MRKGPASSATRAAAARAAAGPKSDGAPDISSLQEAAPHSQLEPAGIKLDDQNASIRLKSTRRANPMYAKETTF
jgi:hypothetical protein